MFDRMLPRRFSFALPVLLVVSGALALPIHAQQDAPMSLQWWHPVAAGAGVAALFVVDGPIARGIQNNRSDALDDMGDITKRFKDPEVFYIAGGGALLLGLAAQQPKVTATGAQIIAAYGLSSGLMIATKWAMGRQRPSVDINDPTSFDFFTGGAQAAFPSGSAAVVFSLATTLADAIDRQPVTIALYTGAVLNAWARLNSNRHWLSDVALGAVYGVAAAKIVNGRWTVFGLQLPTLWTDGRSTSMGYQVTW